VALSGSKFGRSRRASAIRSCSAPHAPSPPPPPPPAQGAVTLERVLQSGEGLDALAEVLGAEDAEAAFGQFAASLLMAVNAMHVDGVVHRGARASVERGLTSAKPLSPAARSVSGAQIPCDALQPQRFDTHALDEGFRIADCGSWVAQSSSRPA